MLLLDGCNGITTEEHLLLREAILEELVHCHQCLVAKDAHQDVLDSFEKLEVVQVDGVRVYSLLEHMVLDGGRSVEECPVEDLQEDCWVTFFSSIHSRDNRVSKVVAHFVTYARSS